MRKRKSCQKKQNRSWVLCSGWKTRGCWILAWCYRLASEVGKSVTEGIIDVGHLWIEEEVAWERIKIHYGTIWTRSCWQPLSFPCLLDSMNCTGQLRPCK
jgi:hypothetical protein